MCGLVAQKILWCFMAWGIVAAIKRKEFQNKMVRDVSGLKVDKGTQM